MTMRWHKWLENKPSFNWSPKSPTAQTPPSVPKSKVSVKTHSLTPVTKQQWLAKLSTLPYGISSCGTVRFGNDNFPAITGYGDYVQGNLTIGHGEDLLTGSRDSNLYTISIYEMANSSPVCLMSKATSLCYSTNDHDDLGKIKAKADIGTFISYSESSGGFHIHNRSTRKIIETIHVKFDELTTMGSECNNLGPGLNCSNFQDSLKEMNEMPSKEDLDNLFGHLYEEYYETRTSEVSDNYATNTLDNKDTSSSSSIIVEDHEAPQLVSSSDEPIANEPSTPVSNNNADECV
nr:hypothetical protein [Tanacetum cinerariifolium]